MKYSSQTATVSSLVDARRSRRLVVNHDYQRYAAWKARQQTAFIDSVLRGYPTPGLTLRHVGSGSTTIDEGRFEIIDGQNRLDALVEFREDRLVLPIPSRRHATTRLQTELGIDSGVWQGRVFSTLTEEDQARLLNTALPVTVVDREVPPSEVCDMFIRLQGGIALDRQQMRDAWPSRLGRFVSNVAGRGPNEGLPLFSMVDGRSDKSGSSDNEDRFVAARKLCAQMLLIFLSYNGDPSTIPAYESEDIDDLYLEYLSFDDHGTDADRFVQVIREMERTLSELRGIRRMWPRPDVLLLLLGVRDALAANDWQVPGHAQRSRVAAAFAEVVEVRTNRKVTCRSASDLRRFYAEEWARAIAD